MNRAPGGTPSGRAARGARHLRPQRSAGRSSGGRSRPRRSPAGSLGGCSSASGQRPPIHDLAAGTHDPAALARRVDATPGQLCTQMSEISDTCAQSCRPHGHADGVSTALRDSARRRMSRHGQPRTLPCKSQLAGAPLEPDSRALPADVEELVADYLAVGIDPARATIFAHSLVPELNQLMLPFLSLVTLPELLRNRQPRMKSRPRGWPRSTV